MQNLNTIRRTVSGLALVAALAVLGWALWHPVAITETVGVASVRVQVDERVWWAGPGTCVPVAWQTDGIQAIYRNGEATVGELSAEHCPADHNGQPLILRVHFGDNIWRTYTLPVARLTPGALGAAGLLLALGGLAWTLPRPVPLAEVRTIREVWPYLLPVLLPWGLLVASNLWSINFGWHWDEITLVNQVRRSIELGTPIPDFYNYPSLSFGLMLVALLQSPGAALSGDTAQTLQIVEENAYWHFARSLFLLVGSMAVVWTYALVLVWRRSWGLALLAASLLALSWEVSYHLRWIAPDGLLMAAGALTMLLTVAAWKFPARGWLLWGAAFVAGLAVGSKYPGGLLIVPALVVAVRRWWGRPLTFWAGRLVGFGVVFVGAYLLTTPGTLLNFPAFWADVTHEIYHYGELGQGYYTVDDGLPHLGQLLAYLGLVAFSRWVPIALAFAVLALVGAVALLREDWPLGVVFLIFPVSYVLYFSTQSVMYVRNMLVVLPYLAVLAAMGAGAVWAALRARPLRYGWAGLLAALLLANAGWQLYSARTVWLNPTTDHLAALVARAEANPETVYWAADGLYDELTAATPDALPPNIQAEADGADMIALWMTDNLLLFDSNYGAYLGRRFRQPWRGVIQHDGPYEVNLNYYPGWDGENRVVIFPVDYVAEGQLAPDLASFADS